MSQIRWPHKRTETEQKKLLFAETKEEEWGWVSLLLLCILWEGNVCSLFYPSRIIFKSLKCKNNNKVSWLSRKCNKTMMFWYNIRGIRVLTRSHWTIWNKAVSLLSVNHESLSPVIFMCNIKCIVYFRPNLSLRELYFFVIVIVAGWTRWPWSETAVRQVRDACSTSTKMCSKAWNLYCAYTYHYHTPFGNACWSSLVLLLMLLCICMFARRNITARLTSCFLCLFFSSSHCCGFSWWIILLILG